MFQHAQKRSLHACVYLASYLAVYIGSSPTQAQQVLQGEYWESQTNGRSSGKKASQQEALNAWLAKSGGFYSQNGPCGPLGTHNYRFCPIKDAANQPGFVDVPLICPTSAFSNIISPNGLGCPSYYVANDIPPLAERCCKDPQGDPINPATGNIYLDETDVVTGTVKFVRYYNSADETDNSLGTGWRHSFSRKIEADEVPKFKPYLLQDLRFSPLYSTPSDACTIGFLLIRSQVPEWATATSNFVGGTCLIMQGAAVVDTLPVFRAHRTPPQAIPTASVRLHRDDGREIVFYKSGSSYIPPKGTNYSLTQTLAGFELRNVDDSLETYDSSGALLTVTKPGGLSYTMQYDTSGRLSAVTDSFGHGFTLTYDSNDRVIEIVAPDSSSTEFAYDSAGRLEQVTHPDGTSRTYLYENSALPTRLTGLLDESASRRSTWGYDAAGRGILTLEGTGANEVSLTYNSDGSVDATDAPGALRVHSFKRIGHQAMTTAISGSRCSTCTNLKETGYDASGYRAFVRDYNDNLTCFVNDSQRGLELVRVEGFGPTTSSCPSNLGSYTPASGTNERKVVTAWHPNYRRPTSIIEAGRVTSFTHDSSGNILTRTVTDTSVTPNVSRTWTYTYNSHGQVLTEDGPRTDVNDVTTYSYYTCTTGDECGQLSSLTNALGHVTTYDSYNAHGQPTQITDANGLVTSLAYDLRQRVTDRCVGGTLPGCAGGELTHMDYWPTGLLKKVTNPDGSSIEYFYDAAHRLTEIRDGALNRVVYTLDAMGNRTAENTYDPGNALRRTHTRIYNTLNQLWKDVNAAGTAAVTTTFGYDNNGNQTSTAAPLGRNSTSLYDELNRLKQITDPASGVTQFGYDANDNLTSVTDPRGLTTSYSYNGLGDLLTQTSPDTGVTTNTYDSGGNLDTSTDSRGVVTDYDYDAANRVISTSFTLGVTDQVITYGYDEGTNQNGLLTSASDAEHDLAWTYDPHGRVTGKGQTVGGTTLALGYGYNAAGQLGNVTLPSGNVISFGYDTNGQVSGLTLNGATTILSGISYDPFGPITGWTWGNGTTASRGFDTDGKVTQVDNANGASLKNYAYDDAFRITGISDALDPSLSWSYGYDALDRLTSANSASLTQGWTYDANGNRLSETGNSPSTYTNSPTSNRVSAVAGSLARSYVYDNAGNALAFGGATFTYNHRGRMASASNGSVTATYTYNALGQRIRRVAAGVTTLYVYDESGHLAGEYTGAGDLIQETVWLGDTPVATLRPDGSGGVVLYYVHADHLNTPRMVTDPANHIRWRWESDPFGTTAPEENPASLGTFVYNLRFPGQQFDAVVGLHYNYFRDYDPDVGRYVQPDPLGIEAGNSLYAYALNNPELFIDPLGLSPFGGMDGFQRCNEGGGRHCGVRHLFATAVAEEGKSVLLYCETVEKGVKCTATCAYDEYFGSFAKFARATYEKSLESTLQHIAKSVANKALRVGVPAYAAVNAARDLFGIAKCSVSCVNR